MWSALLLHGGVWEGVGTAYNASGAWESEQISRVTLTPQNDQQTMHQHNEYFAGNGELSQAKSWTYSSLSRSVLFFDSGAFSQGSTQTSLFGDFGAEFGFLEGEQRLRCIPLYQKGQLQRITLIHEYRPGLPPPPLPKLQPEQLCGHWSGTATTLYADLRPPETSATELQIDFDGPTLKQHLQAGTVSIQSSGAWDGQHLTFPGEMELKIFCLGHGTTCALPPQLQPRTPFFLEVGWLTDPNHRCRLIRRYDRAGGWVSLTLVQESRN